VRIFARRLINFPEGFSWLETSLTFATDEWKGDIMPKVTQNW